MAEASNLLTRLSVRLDTDSQLMVKYLIESGYGQTDLVKAGIELLYQQTKNQKPASVPALLKTFSMSNESGPADLSSNHKDYYQERLLEKYSG